MQQTTPMTSSTLTSQQPPPMTGSTVTSVPPATTTPTSGGSTAVASLIEKVKNEPFTSRQVEHIVSAMPTIPSLTSVEAKELSTIDKR